MYHLQAPPLSLATTWGISVDFFSSGYLDVSVRRVRFLTLWIQIRMTLHTTLSKPPLPLPRETFGARLRSRPRILHCQERLLALAYARAFIKAFCEGSGFPIRTSADQSFIANSPQLFAGLHVLHRL